MSTESPHLPDLNPLVNPPGKIICIGMNYPAPGEALAPPPYPVLFLKAASTLTGPDTAIRIPGAGRRLFCEGEVAVIIGKQAKHVPASEAWRHVVGLTIANDVGAEDLEARTSQWQTGKLPDTFLPVSPNLVPLSNIPDPGDLDIELRINGQMALQGNSGAMLFDIPTLIAYISGLATLYPGDMLVTGSPKGIGDQPAGKAYVVAGDTVSISITGLGTLSNSVAMEVP
ncbi:MAG: fumarylacetoacetate hydrolase family protein [Chloroflexi bacterium]|nr:fumarylacetoacetate hydrolase family protein [Chloroflexota bacterium]